MAYPQTDIRQQNKKHLLQYVYEHREVQQQALTDELGLSRPTVIQILRECERRRPSL